MSKGHTTAKMKNDKLTPSQRKVIECYFKNPLRSWTSVAEECGLSPKSVWLWRYNNLNGFRDEIEERLAHQWDDMKFEASHVMQDLMRQKSFLAAKYILDYAGYKPAEKTELELGNTVQINILGDDDEDKS